MRYTLTCAMLALSALSQAQTPVSGYDFTGKLDPYLNNNPPYVQPLEHRTGGNPTQPYGPTVYASETVGATTKLVANFDAPQFFRALHGMNANGGGGYVNLYTIVMDVKFKSPSIGAFASLFNTTADNGNDGDSFIRWDDNGLGSPTGRIGISGEYAGDITPDEWHRIVITLNCNAGGGTQTQLTYYVDGVFANAVLGASGTDGRWAGYCWNDNDTDGDQIDLLGDNDGDNGSGQVSLAVFFDSELTEEQVVGLGPVGSAIGGGSTTETLAPVNGAVTIGKSTTGGFGDTGAVDGTSWRVCKFVVTSATSPIVRVRFDYVTTKTAPTAIDWDVTAKMVHSGTFKVQLLLSHDPNNPNNNAGYDVVLPQTAINTTMTSYTGNAVNAPLSQYVGTAGTMSGRVEIYRTFSAVAAPCVEVDGALLKVTG